MDSIAMLDLCSHGQDLQMKETLEKERGKEIKQALANTGFCYLLNHGIDEDLIKQFQEASRYLFKEPTEQKKTYAVRWRGTGVEALNKKRPADLKEVFTHCPAKETTLIWPEGNYETLTKTMFTAFAELTHRVLKVLSYGLNWDADVLKDGHSLIGKRGNRTAPRTHYYPPPDNYTLLDDQIRCGEHTDFGTITFLVQDEVGGLEVLVPGTGSEEEYVSVEHIPGAIIVMVGALLQRWTADGLPAQKHRVVIGDRSVSRLSLGYFVNPNDEAIIRCLDGSEKYEPIKAVDYIRGRSSESIKVESDEK